MQKQKRYTPTLRHKNVESNLILDRVACGLFSPQAVSSPLSSFDLRHGGGEEGLFFSRPQRGSKEEEEEEEGSHAGPSHSSFLLFSFFWEGTVRVCMAEQRVPRNVVSCLSLYYVLPSILFVCLLRVCRTTAIEKAALRQRPSLKRDIMPTPVTQYHLICENKHAKPGQCINLLPEVLYNRITKGFLTS